MKQTLDVQSIRFTPSGAADRDRGLLGYLAFNLGEVRIDGVALRRTLEGKLTLSYPQRSRGRGRTFPIVRPLNENARVQLEGQILNSLRAQSSKLARHRGEELL